MQWFQRICKTPMPEKIPSHKSTSSFSEGDLKWIIFVPEARHRQLDGGGRLDDADCQPFVERD